MFNSHITLRQFRNIFPDFRSTLTEDDFFQVCCYDFASTFRRDKDGAVLLGGEVWGTLTDLMNTTVVDCKLDRVDNPSHCTIWVTAQK